MWVPYFWPTPYLSTFISSWWTTGSMVQFDTASSTFLSTGVWRRLEQWTPKK